ncbi:MAG: hypothetical protein HY319_00675 [Armatimonadetes bacterium]|nr:hypothetical protein [Armatimonadota bacterium]
MRRLTLLAALLVLFVAHAAWAGKEVNNDEGIYDRFYGNVVVKDAGGDKAEVAQGAKAKVEGETVWVYLPEAEKPFKTRAVIFYDWGYQLEITVYDSETEKRYILLCPRKAGLRHPGSQH